MVPTLMCCLLDMGLLPSFLLPVLRTPRGPWDAEIGLNKRENPLGQMPEGARIPLISAVYLRCSGCLEPYEDDAAAEGSDDERARDNRTTKRTMASRIGIPARRASPSCQSFIGTGTAGPSLAKSSSRVARSARGGGAATVDARFRGRRRAPIDAAVAGLVQAGGERFEFGGNRGRGGFYDWDVAAERTATGDVGAVTGARTSLASGDEGAKLFLRVTGGARARAILGR